MPSIPTPNLEGNCNPKAPHSKIVLKMMPHRRAQSYTALPVLSLSHFGKTVCVFLSCPLLVSCTQIKQQNKSSPHNTHIQGAGLEENQSYHRRGVPGPCRGRSPGRLELVGPPNSINPHPQKKENDLRVWEDTSEPC